MAIRFACSSGHEFDLIDGTLSAGDRVWCPVCGAAVAGADRAAPLDSTAATPGTTDPDDTVSLQDRSWRPGTSSHPRRLGQYELLTVLGRGGMGVVYEARQPTADRTVACKVILPDRLGGEPGEAALERFRTEVRAAGRLAHDNIVPIYDVGEVGGQPYYTMRLIRGRPLAALLRDGPLPGRQAATYLEAVARAVAAAHDAGVLHRDLKPGNVLVEDQTDRPYVTDFGLAKIAAHEPGMTIAGQMLGSPPYMAPEQARDPRDATPLSDIYSLGATLFHALTGRPPHQAATPAETLLQVLEAEPVAPRRLNAAIDRDLETVCLKCLHKEPSRRYGSAAELADDLARYLAGQPILARRAGPVERAWLWSRRNPWLAGSLALSVLILIAGAATSTVFAVREAHAAAEAREQGGKLATANSQLAATNQNLTESLQSRDQAMQHASQLAISRGILLGRQGESRQALLWLAAGLSFAPSSADALQVAARENLDYYAGRISPLVAAAPVGSPVVAAAVTPDGKRAIIATAEAPLTKAPGKVLLWNLERPLEQMQVLAQSSAIRTVTVSADGRLVAAAWDNQAQAWSAETGHPAAPPLAHGMAVNAIAFSPSGKLLATAAAEPRDATGGQIQLWNVAAGAAAAGPVEHPGAATVAFSRRGDWLASGGADGHVRLWSLPDLTLKSQSSKHPMPVAQIAVGADDKQLVARATANDMAELWLWDVSVSPPRGARLARSTMLKELAASFLAGPNQKITVWEEYNDLAIAPRGTRLATAGRIMRGTKDAVDWPGEAILWDLAKREPLLSPATFTRPVRRIALDPAGRWMAAGTGDLIIHAGEVRLWNAGTEQPREPDLPHRGAVLALAFGPQTLVSGTSEFREGTVNLWQIHTPPRDVIEIRAAGAIERVAFTPDSRRIVIAGNSSDRNLGTIQVCDVATGKPIYPPLALDSPATDLALSPDGKRALAGCRSGVARLWDVDTGQWIGQSLKHDQSVSSTAFSPDGSIVATSAGRQVRLWEAATGDPIGKPLEHDSLVSLARFSPHGKLLAVGTFDGEAVLWRAASGEPYKRLRHGEPTTIYSLAFRPQGDVLATGSFEGSARYWNVETGEQAGETMWHDTVLKRIYSLSFDAKGERLLTGSMDRTARQWDLQGKSLGAPLAHPNEVAAVAYRPDGKQIATSCLDNRIRYWEPQTGLAIGVTRRNSSLAMRIVYSPDGRLLASTATGGRVTIRTVPQSMPGDAATIRKKMETMTGMQLDADGVCRPLSANAWRERLP
jgi:WD40 repeat protein